MEHTKADKERAHESPVKLLNQLRWILAGLQMGGIKDWPARSFPVASKEQEPAPSVPVVAGPAAFPDAVDLRGNQRGEILSVPPPLKIPPAPPLEKGGERTGPLGPEPPFVAEDMETLPLPDLDEPSSCPEPGPGLSDPAHVDMKSPEEALHHIREKMGECKRCRLHSGRTHLVFADGSPQARLVFVGEGPGFDEDKQGLPFVGRAGKLLDKMIRSIGFVREEVYICNVVKCRPPNNRTPNPDEIEACSPFLVEQLNALRPQAICALGACAAQTLLGTSNSISRLRGKIHRWRGIPLVCTYHPAYLLRTPSQKAATWQDLLMIARVLQGDSR